MLTERIAALYALLQCNNTDIAHYAGCSPGNISRLKSGLRAPGPESRTIAVFAEGVYGYADYENLLDALRELCGAADGTRESVIPALIAWLYETKEISPPPRAAVPKSKQAKALRRRGFGERLDRTMTLLELSNTKLAALLSIDVSLISRWRCGIHSPHRNKQLSERLSAVLLERAEKSEQTSELAALCGVPAAELDASAVALWLLDVSNEDGTVLAQALAHSLDNLAPGQGLSPDAPEIPPIETVSCYWGTEGLRSAVVRFLTDAAQRGGELLLYSDEPMEWMTQDRAYFALWASLMAKCVQSGVRIKIIHNVDRVSSEMIDAIKGWFPLYISGMIEPYVFPRARNTRFCHTVFLRTGGACIRAFFPVGSGNGRWYDYITDAPHLDALKREYGAMLASATPFLKTYTAAMGAEFRTLRVEKGGPRDYLLTVLPVFTMPDGLLTRILDRTALAEDRRAEVLNACRALRRRFLELLQSESVRLLLCPPVEGARRVNFSLDLLDLSVEYTEEEYAEHLAAVRTLVQTERSFHLTLLPAAPFRDIQIITLGDAVALLRSSEPHTAFVFMNPALMQSMSNYFDVLIGQFATDRASTAAALEELRCAGRASERVFSQAGEE